VKPNELLLEKSVADALTDALLHLVRNAVDHGIESAGKVTLVAQTSEAGTLHLSVTDNGRGIDAANLPLLFQPGFSTATEVSETSGRGVGLDAVKAAVEQVGGSVNVVSYPGEFTSFVITIPSSDA
jgi:two-component system chemotaxis sensor kinase CheA